MIISFLFLHFQQTINQVRDQASNGQCVWYGVCNQIGSHKLYCAYDGPAKPVDDEGKDLLAKWCPNLLKEHNNNLCCDNEQVHKLFIILLTATHIIPQTTKNEYLFIRHRYNVIIIRFY